LLYATYIAMSKFGCQEVVFFNLARSVVRVESGVSRCGIAAGVRALLSGGHRGHDNLFLNPLAPPPFHSFPVFPFIVIPTKETSRWAPFGSRESQASVDEIPRGLGMTMEVGRVAVMLADRQKACPYGESCRECVDRFG
jgi:hypothetical protein